LARETINRELHKLEQEGLVELMAGSIIIQLPELEARLSTVL
jgi:DNA-binding transcriptional regulator LsrR (DeoR family)